MKKIILLLFLLITLRIYGQDVNTTVYNSFYRDTLTATIDTVQLKFQSGFDYFTISIYSSGTDTVDVYTKGEGNYALWAQKGLIDLSTNSIVSQIIATSTVKEYLVLDPNTMWIRLITTDGSANAIFTVNAKKGNYAINATTPLTLPLPTGAATSANQSIQIDYLHPASSFTTVIDTVKTDSTGIIRSRDTLSIGGTKWAKVTIRGLSATDSLAFGIGTTAPSTWQRVFGVTPFVSEKLDKTYFTKVFIKGYGADDSVKSYQVTIEAY